MSHVTCHMASVTCHMPCVFFFYRLVELVHGGSVINGATPSSFIGFQILCLSGSFIISFVDSSVFLADKTGPLHVIGLVIIISDMEGFISYPHSSSTSSDLIISSISSISSLSSRSPLSSSHSYVFSLSPFQPNNPPISRRREEHG